jgi:hypothetical protein
VLQQEKKKPKDGLLRIVARSQCNAWRFFGRYAVFLCWGSMHLSITIC